MVTTTTQAAFLEASASVGPTFDSVSKSRQFGFGSDSSDCDLPGCPNGWDDEDASCNRWSDETWRQIVTDFPGKHAEDQAYLCPDKTDFRHRRQQDRQAEGRKNGKDVKDYGGRYYKSIFAHVVALEYARCWRSAPRYPPRSWRDCDSCRVVCFPVRHNYSENS